MLRGAVRVSCCLTIGVALSVACSGSSEFQASGSGGKAGSEAGVDATSDAPAESAADSGAVNGQSCSSAAACASGHCTDGVCCDSACDGACESCGLTGQEGTCTPYALGDDPENECATFDGCEKVCDGKGACLSCGLFQCGSADSCLDTCASAADCKDGAWCNGGSCEAKKVNGAACSDSAECTSDVCALGSCCNVGCFAPATCATGDCLCDGVACTPGDTCTTFYADTDNDTYGDPAASKLACKSTPPQSYVENSEDCYDNNPNAHPGQTAWFTVPRGSDGSYDYDCNNQETHEYPNVSGKTCATCNCTSGCYVRFGCNATCPGGLFDTGYTGNIGCGIQSTLLSCKDTNPGSGCTATQSNTANTPQGCH